MNINELLVRYINELLVQWWESERRVLVCLGPGKHKNAVACVKLFGPLSVPKVWCMNGRRVLYGWFCRLRYDLVSMN